MKRTTSRMILLRALADKQHHDVDELADILYPNGEWWTPHCTRKVLDRMEDHGVVRILRSGCVKITALGRQVLEQ